MLGELVPRHITRVGDGEGEEVGGADINVVGPDEETIVCTAKRRD